MRHFDRPRARRCLAIPVLMLLALYGASRAASQDRPNEEPSSFDTLMDRSDLGNVAQAAMMSYHAGSRDLERARKLAEKSAASDDEKGAKLLQKSEAAYESAIRQLTEAVRLNPKLTRAYSALGRAYLETGNPQASLEVHSSALRVDANDADNLEGRAEALLAMGQLRETAMAYDSLRAAHREAAARLLGTMKRWVEEHRRDPGAVDPTAVEALATLIQQWEREG